MVFVLLLWIACLRVQNTLPIYVDPYLLLGYRLVLVYDDEVEPICPHCDEFSFCPKFRPKDIPTYFFSGLKSTIDLDECVSGLLLRYMQSS